MKWRDKMKKVDEFMKRLRFGFSEVDATLNGWEMLGSVILGIGICTVPFLIKWILLLVHFGGM